MISWAIARDFVLFGDKIKLTLSQQLLSAEKSYCSYVERGQDNREYQGTAGNFPIHNRGFGFHSEYGPETCF